MPRDVDAVGGQRAEPVGGDAAVAQSCDQDAALSDRVAREQTGQTGRDAVRGPFGFGGVVIPADADVDAVVHADGLAKRLLAALVQNLQGGDGAALLGINLNGDAGGVGGDAGGLLFDGKVGVNIR